MMRCLSLRRSLYFTTQHVRLSTMSQTIPPILSVRPTRALVDEKFKVLVENLPAGSPVTVHSLHHSEDKDYWEAFAHYISDHRGTVSVADDMSFGGTYAGKEPMGLLWSMRPVPGSRKGLRYTCAQDCPSSLWISALFFVLNNKTENAFMLRKMDVHSPMLVNISVYSGHIAEGFREQPPLASVLTERWYMAPGVQRIDIREKGVRGTLFIPPGPGPFPGLLDMWGTGGGLMEYRSALLASHGYVSLALEYFSPGELKSADVEFKYFETAFNIVKDHPQVIPDRVGLFGLSLGATLTMYVAAESTVIKPRCCVCVSGGYFYPRGETLSVFYKMMIRDSHKVRLDVNGHQIWLDVTLPITSDLSRKADVRKINCPVLLVSGHDDQNTPVVESAEDVAQMMHAAGKEHLLTRLHYPDTGHLIEPPYSPHIRACNFIVDSTKAKMILLMGGQTKPHSDAQEDSWRKILAFLQQHLYSRSSPKAKT